VVEPERRTNPRFACDVAASIVIDEATPSPRRVVDISRGGISMLGEDPVTVGTHLMVHLQASADDGDTESLDIGATVVWCTQTKDGTYQIGARFDEAKGRDRSQRFEHLLELLCRPG
jgi:c-di-GMP-binding flagellar brake protein YcgR